ncbi:glucokinase [Gemmobacter megaterium]|uniref:Glucokinase n=1 Tax=Gemmobacter megaterium TaxID=1086013 RepID=A0A1N7Q2V2_9RHOB|nr:glucokinase [Gemmobacter megaterium]GGE22505.1 glucokinase [Gemmobacter megaterium]SIT17155.1 glucokinase [Gemmobacter megaterium]
MTILIADIGGTNCRFALGRQTVLPDTVARFRLKDHHGFDAALDHYLAGQGQPVLTSACLAVAGPVIGACAQLTNSGWSLDASVLAGRLGVDVTLVNDLVALGHALPHLSSAATVPLHAPAQRYPNGQSVVVGLGTGTNIAAVIHRAERPPAVLSAEAGHLSLPGSITRRLEGRIGAGMSAFHSAESIFSGRGLAALHTALHGATVPSLALTSHPEVPEAGETLSLHAELLGVWLQEIALLTLPRNGIWLAGGVAQGLVRAGYATVIAEAFAAPNSNNGPTGAIPMHLITDDLAALTGCLAAVRQA